MPSRTRRDSLPRSIASSTVATEAKARRRQSARQQHQQQKHKKLVANKQPRMSLTEFKAQQRLLRATANENEKPYYSPPLTRSAKKTSKQTSGSLSSTDGTSPASSPNNNSSSNGGVMTFSPPDPIRNAELRRQQLAQAQAEHEARVAGCRNAGQLLEFSPTNRASMARGWSSSWASTPHKEEEEGDDRCGLDPPPTHDESSPPPPASIVQHPIDPEEATEQVSQMTEMHHPGDPPDSVLVPTSLMTAPTAEGTACDPQLRTMLEQMNGRLDQLTTNELQISHLHELQTAEKDKFRMEKTRLEEALKQERATTAATVRALEEARDELLVQVKELRHDRGTVNDRTHQLEKDLERALGELVTAQRALEDSEAKVKVDAAKDTDKHREWEEKVAVVNSEKQELNMQVRDLQQAIDSLQSECLDKQQQIASLKMEINQQNMHHDSLESENTKLEERLSSLQTEIDGLKAEMSTERQNYSQLNQDSVAAFEKLTQASIGKDEQIRELLANLDEVRVKVDQHRQQAADDMQAVQGREQELRMTVAEWKRQCQSLTTELEAAKASCKVDKLAAAEEQEGRLAAEASLQQSQSANDSALAKLQSQVDELNKALLQSMDSVDELEKNKARMESQLSQRDASVAAINAQLCAARTEKEAEVEKLTWELGVACRELETAEDLLSSAKKKAEEMSVHQKAELTKERNRREAAERRLAALERDLLQTETERNAAQENMESFEERETRLYTQLRESDRLRRKMHAKLMQLMGNIRVFVRVRPALEGEEEEADQAAEARIAKHKRNRDEMEGDSCPFSFPHTDNRIVVKEPRRDRGGLRERRKTWDYSFDQVFAPSRGQEEVWEATEPLIQCAVDGFNVTVFAYGQTGSGKTYTMLGEPGNEGLIARSVRKLFASKAELESLYTGTSVSLAVELLEVYNEKVRDLLSNNSEVDVKVTSQEVVGNMVVQTTSEEQVLQILDLAQTRRCVKATQSNAESSRSHMLFTIHFDVTLPDGTVRCGKLNVCDLAGSERLSKSGAHHVGGALLEETKAINKSLSVLSNVIERLQSGDVKNVPFRESKLTFLLKDSLSGNSKTLAIVCCNPLSAHFQESLSSLRFAEKVNRVDLKAVANFSC